MRPDPVQVAAARHDGRSQGSERTQGLVGALSLSLTALPAPRGQRCDNWAPAGRGAVLHALSSEREDHMRFPTRQGHGRETDVCTGLQPACGAAGAPLIIYTNSPGTGVGWLAPGSPCVSGR